MKELIKRIYRYSWGCIAVRLDPDFANASREVVETLKDCRNELCNLCGKYKEEHNGACDGCRWKH